jgi:pimeloyl-ACP methyl ester carboxylesterase
MLPAETVRTEGPRYAARLVLIPALWTGPAAWRGFATALGHRGWECHLVDVRGVRGGVEARAAAVDEYAASLAVPVVLIGHDTGGLVAAAAARRAAAVVLLAPLAPGTPGARAVVRSPRAVLAMLLGRPVPPPAGRIAAERAGDVAAAARDAVVGVAGPEDAATVREVAWGRVQLAPPGVPALVLRGEHDPLLRPAEAPALAGRRGAELHAIDGAAHWPLAGPAWQRAVDTVHRWVVQRLGAPLLERYEEAMAERDADDEDDAPT